ncbi:hypothetical protein [Enterovibrio coralii]|uniref:Chromosome partitioning protein ParA n=1 Tax=Enterovibrio coralii TaxID=294935 RepID=A0A135IB14_9GAMM|nr:hypothetical protein [Enterovibrio coralii]KXF82663.1 hypothetical protein ATN88_14290 [Enterovibrio coralii]
MNFKASILAASVALVLAGCNDDESTTSVNPTTPTYGEAFTGKFVDAAVEGLFYKTSSGTTGITDAEGSFNAREGETVTFFIGGENGIKIGAASGRGIITPFEGAGKYNSALNTAILLQTLDKMAGGDATGMLTVPEELRSMNDPRIAKLLSNVVLSSKDSVENFLTAMGASEIVDEETALAHMTSVLDSSEYKRGDDKAISDFALDNGKVVRFISSSLTVANTPDGAESLFIHADKTLTEEEFNDTRGMTTMLFKFESDGVTTLAGTNDYYSSSDVNAHFKTILLDKSKELQTDEKDTWESIPDFGPLACADTATGCTSLTLNALTDDMRDDNTDNSGSEDWQREIQSGFYDPITGVHTVARKKIKCTSADETSCNGRTTTYMDFYYTTNSKSEDRYVDFVGDWVETSVCENGDIAKLNFAFDSKGLTMSGTECSSDGGDTSAEPIETEAHDYAALASIDYWWFNQAGRESKATLTELNSGVLFCDDNNYIPGSSCSKQFVIKWEYQPAGKAWDEGILTRYKYKMDGTLDSRQVMQKVKS